MGDIDYKQIGLAAKDIVIGIGAAAAGATGGPAAAEGVMKAGSGIDKIVEAAVPSDKKQTRADKFDRADFNVKKATPPAGGQTAPGNPTPQAPAGEPVDVDAKATADYLAARGWPPEKVQQILRGPGVNGENSVSAIVGKQVDGKPVALASASAVELKAGTTIELKDGKPVPQVPGEAQRMVAGAAVKAAADTNSA